MTATYSLNLPAPLDRMRFALGDVDMAFPLEQDETYTANYTLYGEQLGTAVMAEALAARYAQQPDSLSDSGTSVSWRERVSTWLTLAKTLRSSPSSEVGMASRSMGAGASYGSRGDATDSEYVRSGTTWWTG